MGKAEEKIEKKIKKGYNIVTETGKTTVMEKQKKFSWFWFIFLLIFGGGIGGLIYLAWYLSKKNKRRVISRGEAK